MNRLTKLFLFYLLVIVGSQINAQEISLKGGLNYSNVSYHWNNENHSDQFSSKLGFQLGAIAQLPISDKFSINTGAMFVQRQHKYVDVRESDSEWHLEPNKWYVELPVLLRREFRLNKVCLFGEIGPYVGCGIAISQDIKHYQNGELIDEGSFYAEWGSGDNDTKRFDVGINLGLGILLNKLELGFSYAHGFINTENVDYREQKNRAFFINCAYPLFSFTEQK